MIDWAEIGLPMLSVLLLWFLSTGAVAWLNNRSRQSHGRTLVLAGVIAMGGLALVLVSLHTLAAWAAYASFFGGLMIWSWHEISFLTGAVSGTHRDPCPIDARGWDRFSRASATLIHHEMALAMTALLLVSLSWNAATPTGAMLFVLLFLFRLSAKFNIYIGVPNFSDELLPLHMSHLKSYFGARGLHPMLIVSIVMIAAIAGWFAYVATIAPSLAVSVQNALLAAISLLALLEHLFMALPFRDSRLWQWAIAVQTDKQNY